MREINIVNLTNTIIRIYPDEYSDIPIPIRRSDKDKFLMRCVEIQPVGAAKSEIYRDEDSAKAIIRGAGKKTVRLSYSHIGIVSGLPEPKEDTIYIVSQLTYNAIYHIRKDVWMIDKPIRSEDGGVLACRGFSRCIYDIDNKYLNVVDKLLKKLFGKSVPGQEANEIAEAIYSLTKYREK